MIEQMLDIGFTACEVVIDTKHIMTALDQTLAKVRT
jgi:hypothetical protein